MVTCAKQTPVFPVSLNVPFKDKTLLEQLVQSGVRSSTCGQPEIQQPCTSAVSGLRPVTVWGSYGRRNGLTYLIVSKSVPRL
jgi:hypothetical protein